MYLKFFFTKIVFVKPSLRQLFDNQLKTELRRFASTLQIPPAADVNLRVPQKTFWKKDFE